MKKYDLDFEKTMDYFNSIMEGGNTLSLELKRNLCFENGQFFTLLPEDANFEDLYDFWGGWILPQNPTFDQFDKLGKKSGSYTLIPTLDMEISNFICEKMLLHPNYVCLFEDVVRQLSDPHLEFFHQYGFLYLEEIYFLLNKDNVTSELIRSTINQSGVIWHTLFMLSFADNSKIIEKNITIDGIKEFCLNTRMLIIGAYDGEGYVFWEPL